MDKRKVLHPEKKLQILKSYYRCQRPDAGANVTAVCRHYGVSRQNLSDWREMLEANVDLVFSRPKDYRTLLEENKRLRERIDELKTELIELGSTMDPEEDDEFLWQTAD